MGEGWGETETANRIDSWHERRNRIRRGIIKMVFI